MSYTELTWQENLDHFTKTCPIELLKSIDQCQGVNEKIDLCLQNNDVKKSIRGWIKHRIITNKFAKNAIKSIQLRQDGNKVFAGPNPDQAIDIYTKAILSAPEDSEELRLGYGNLSAVLYHKEKFRDCITAIDKSLTPDNEIRCLKLHLRKAKSLLHLGRTKEAIRSVDDAERLFEYLTSQHSKQSSLHKFKSELSECRRIVAVDLDEMNSRLVPEEPEFDNPEIVENSDFPFASKYIELRRSAEKGRYVVARKRLKFGSVLFCEKPVAFVVLPQFRQHFCNHCCHKIRCPIPCDGCSGLVYCSEECRDGAYSYHQYECSGGLYIAYSTGIAHLALRLLLVRDQDPDAYSRATSLLHHMDRMSPEDLFNYALTGYALSFYLNEVSFSPLESTVYDLTLHIGRLVMNGHSVEDIRAQDRISGTQISVEMEDTIAAAIYPSASMMNHSCKSNIANCFYGKYLIVKSNQDIEESQEVFNSYGLDCMRDSRKQRQKALKTQYKFSCYCQACTADVDPNEIFTSLACIKCSGPVVRSRCIDCATHYTSMRETVRCLQEADEKYSLAMDYIKRDWSRALEILEEVLETRKKYLYKMNRDIGLVYNGITKCHTALGNYELAYKVVKECHLPMISERFGANSIELANEMFKCISVFCTSIMSKYSATSPNCDVHDSEKLNECVKMMEQTEVLFELYYGPWNERYRKLINFKNFLVPLSQVWQYFLQNREITVS